MNEMRFAFLDSLGSPELCCVLDIDWFRQNRNELVNWFRSQGHAQDLELGIFLVPKELRTIFMLKFQDLSG